MTLLHLSRYELFTIKSHSVHTTAVVFFVPFTKNSKLGHPRFKPLLVSTLTSAFSHYPYQKDGRAKSVRLLSAKVKTCFTSPMTFPFIHSSAVVLYISLFGYQRLLSYGSSNLEDVKSFLPVKSIKLERNFVKLYSFVT